MQSDCMEKLLSVKQAADTYGVHPQTIRLWTENGKLNSFRTPSGHRRIVCPAHVTSFNPQQIRPNKEETRPSGQKDRIVYCRVSSQKQKDDLERQVRYMQERFPGYKVLTDIGSGINFRRKSLRALLDAALSGTVEEVVVASRDRLCRFAFDLLEWLLQRSGTKLTILQQGDESPEAELSDDVLSIIQVFCCRRNGRRRYPTAAALSHGTTDREKRSACKAAADYPPETHDA